MRRLLALAIFCCCTCATASAAVAPLGTVTEFSGVTPGSKPYGITTAPDGNLWFVEIGGARIGRATVDGRITEFSAGATPLSTPGFGIGAGPDGNVWYPEIAAGQVGRITPDGRVTEFRLPSPAAQPAGIVTGSDGALWASEGGPEGDRTDHAGRPYNGVLQGHHGWTLAACPRT